MKKQFTQSKLSTPRSIKGLTLIEVLIALAIGALILGTSFAITMSNRKLVTRDQTRTAVNQNARSALDIIGADIRNAGERLSARNNIRISAIELVNGNELIVRRNLLNTVLPMCEGDGLIKDSTEKEIIIGYTDNLLGVDLNLNPECRIVDTVNDGVIMSDSYAAWKSYRGNEDNDEARAFIFTTSGKSEFFTYSSEDTVLQAGVTRFRIHRKNGKWQNTYALNERPSIILLEEKHYRINNGVLEVITDKDTTNIEKVVSGITGFSVKAFMQDGTTKTTLDSSIPWNTVASIEVSIKTKVKIGGEETERTLTSSFFPRNILSN
jgi:prepilin-type N-terminal cleavage/methylation domain-containing protein